jgi:hypothetical protein
MWKLPGGKRLWSRLEHVRDVRIERIEPIRLGAISP